MAPDCTRRRALSEPRAEEHWVASAGESAVARALVLGQPACQPLQVARILKTLEIDYFGENTQPEEDLNGRAEWTFLANT